VVGEHTASDDITTESEGEHDAELTTALVTRRSC